MSSRNAFIAGKGRRNIMSEAWLGFILLRPSINRESILSIKRTWAEKPFCAITLKARYGISLRERQHEAKVASGKILRADANNVDVRRVAMSSYVFKEYITYCILFLKRFLTRTYLTMTPGLREILFTFFHRESQKRASARSPSTRTHLLKPVISPAQKTSGSCARERRASVTRDRASTASSHSSCARVATLPPETVLGVSPFTGKSLRTRTSSWVTRGLASSPWPMRDPVLTAASFLSVPSRRTSWTVDMSFSERSRRAWMWWARWNRSAAHRKATLRRRS